MDKASATKYATVLRDAAAEMRKMAHELADARSRLAAIEQDQAVDKIAQELHARNIRTDLDGVALRTLLSKEAQAGNLGQYETVLSLVAPDQSAKLAQLRDEPSGSGGGARAELERYLSE